VAAMMAKTTAVESQQTDLLYVGVGAHVHIIQCSVMLGRRA
jgi:hypothetical protein